LKTLGLRLNFINDDGFNNFFDKVVFSGISKLENLYIRENNINIKYNNAVLGLSTSGTTMYVLNAYVGKKDFV
jgi:hypothetical protein